MKKTKTIRSLPRKSLIIDRIERSRQVEDFKRHLKSVTLFAILISAIGVIILEVFK